jgi:hypothetical protein
MTKAALISTLFVLGLYSCKVTEKDIPGLYKLDKFPKTTLQINSDNTFEFSKNNRNPYLHPFEHQNEYFADTKGTWRIVDKKNISLTSQSDSLIYPLVSLQTYPARDRQYSNITFFDKYSDTVKILYVQYSNGSSVAVFHSSMDYFTEDMTKRDTLEFHFYGYRPYTLINGQKKNQDYKITLKPSFQPNFFKETVFRIKRKKLIDIKRKVKFRQTKSSM